MASLDLEKLTLSEARGRLVHLGQREREQLNHSNPDIDKSLTPLNYTIGCSDYSEAVRKMEERTKEVDEVQPPKRNMGDKRIVAVSVWAPCPQSIRDSGRADEFHQAVYDFLCDYYGAENVHGMCVHKDEIHTYVDKQGEARESLEHSHTLVSAYTKTKGINGKEFTQKKNLIDVQKAMNKMVRERFGTDYNTGDTPSKKTVEQLKREQIKAKTEKEIVDTQKELSKVTAEVETAKAQRAEIEKENEEFVRALTPEPTKTTKSVFGKEKVIEKTAEEKQRDLEIAAAQAVLKEKEKIENDRKELDKAHQKIREKEAALNEILAQQRKAFDKEIIQLKEENQALKARLKQFIDESAKQARAAAIAMAIRVRTQLEKTLKKMGLHSPQGYTTDEQIRNSERALMTTEQQKGR